MNKLVITTKRLMIRNLELKDLNAFHLYRSNPEITRYQGFDVMSIEECRNFIEQQKDRHFGVPGEWLQYGIENLETGAMVGDCAIRLEQGYLETAEIGITISHLYQRQGFAKEVLSGIMKYLFEVRNIHRIVETVDVDNKSSIYLMEAVGFRKEGHFIENIFFKGSWGSEFQYAMLKREWEQIQNTCAQSNH